MKIPKILADRMKKIECLRRHYPKSRPQPEQVTVLLETTALEGKPAGFLVCRFLMKPTENPKEFMLESPFDTNFYEPKELLQALDEFKKDTLPELAPTPTSKFLHKPWQRPPKLTLERKKLPEKGKNLVPGTEIPETEKIRLKPGTTEPDI